LKTFATLLNRYHRALAGFVSALIGSVIDGELQDSTVLMFWALIRSVRCFLPSIPGGPVIVMAICACQILSVWIFSPVDLDRRYKSFLDVHGTQTHLSFFPRLALPPPYLLARLLRLFLPEALFVSSVIDHRLQAVRPRSRWPKFPAA